MLKIGCQLAIAAVPMAIVTAQPSVPSPGEPTLEQVRAATARFRDVNVALAEGYIRDPMNVSCAAHVASGPQSMHTNARDQKDEHTRMVSGKS